MAINQQRVIVYESQDGSTEVFVMFSKEEEQHERAQAERELHSRANLESNNPMTGYHFEWRDK